MVGERQTDRQTDRGTDLASSAVIKTRGIAELATSEEKGNRAKDEEDGTVVIESDRFHLRSTRFVEERHSIPSDVDHAGEELPAPTTQQPRAS